MIYLASPYSHPDPMVREERFLAVCRAAAQMLSSGVFVFAPIAQCHPIAVHGNLHGTFDFWEAYDRQMLTFCDELLVLMLEGWRESVGVQAEIKIMEEMRKPVNYLEWR
jgi:hypothetical protein